MVRRLFASSDPFTGSERERKKEKERGRERQKVLPLLEGRKGATHSILTAFTQAMKTPILIDSDEQATHTGIFATSINEGRQCT